MLEQIRKYPGVATSVRHAISSSGSPIDPELRLAAALRWLAGASYLDLARISGIARSAVMHVVWSVLEAIDNEFSINFPMQDEEKLRALATGFLACLLGHINGCVAAGKSSRHILN